MSTPFYPIGPTAIVETTPTGPSTATGNISINFGSAGNPNIVRVWNGDSTNPMAVVVGWDSTVEASMPDSEPPSLGVNGQGVILAPFGSADILLDSTYQTGNLWVSVATTGSISQAWVNGGVLG